MDKVWIVLDSNRVPVSVYDNEEAANKMRDRINSTRYSSSRWRVMEFSLKRNDEG